MKKLLKKQAVELRTQGHSMGEIAKILKTSKGNVHRWTRHVELTEQQKEKLATNKILHAKNFFKNHNFENRVQNLKQKRINWQNIGKQEIQTSSWKHAAGCMLYWAEGSKSKNTISFTNCDARMLCFFVEFLKQFYNVKNENIHLTFQYHGQLDSQAIFDYWINKLNIPNCVTTKPSLKNNKKSETKHLYGICRIRVHSTEIANKLWGSIQQYIGFSDFEYLK